MSAAKTEHRRTIRDLPADETVVSPLPATGSPLPRHPAPVAPTRDKDLLTCGARPGSFADLCRRIPGVVALLGRARAASAPRGLAAAEFRARLRAEAMRLVGPGSDYNEICLNLF
jgi:hypothetical protein